MYSFFLNVQNCLVISLGKKYFEMLQNPLSFMLFNEL